LTSRHNFIKVASQNWSKASIKKRCEMLTLRMRFAYGECSQLHAWQKKAFRITRLRTALLRRKDARPRTATEGTWKYEQSCPLHARDRPEWSRGRLCGVESVEEMNQRVEVFTKDRQNIVGRSLGLCLQKAIVWKTNACWKQQLRRTSGACNESPHLLLCRLGFYEHDRMSVSTGSFFFAYSI
jgi:hypothetical protein